MSRAHILNKATEYIRQMQKASAQRSDDIESLKKKNELLEEQGSSKLGEREVCIPSLSGGFYVTAAVIWSSRCSRAS